MMKIKLAVLFGLSLLVVGCGGGGGAGNEGPVQVATTAGTTTAGTTTAGTTTAGTTTAGTTTAGTTTAGTTTAGTTTAGTTTDGATTAGASTVEELQLQRELAWLYDKMKSEYLWYDETPDLDFQSFASADDLLDAMIVTSRDRFSYLTTAERNTASQTATNVTYGFRVLTSVQPFKVMRVYDGSSAAVAGVKRADSITRIGTIEIVDSASAEAAWDLAGARTEGSTLEFEFARENESDPIVVSLTATEVSRQTVDAYMVREDANGNGMGYLSIFEFRSKTDDELRDAFAFFGDNNVQTLVVDLRDNGGGSIRSIAVLGSLILGSEQAAKPFIDFRFSDLGEAIFSNGNFTTGYNLQIEDNAVPVSKVHIIASNRTCSASEILINSLRSYVDVSVSGVTTCGKPYGFYGRAFEEKSVLWAINFQSDNANGEGGWVDGIDPTCEVNDYEIYPYGDLRDRHLLSATKHLETGTCEVSTTLAQSGTARSGSGSMPSAIYNPVWEIDGPVDQQY